MNSPENLPKEKVLVGESADEQLLLELESYGAKITGDPFAQDAYIARFSFEGGATTTIRLALHDAQSGADMVITNMTTLPDDMKGKGYGSESIKHIIDWAQKHNFSKICATQVNTERSKRFWKSNGFVEATRPNLFNDYIYLIIKG